MTIDPKPPHGGTAGDGHADRLHTIEQIAVSEARRFLVMFLYLWLLFGLFALHEDIVLRDRGIGFAFHGFALVNALVLAKVMLIAEDLKLGHRLRARPLVYPIVTEALILAALFIVVHILEHVFGGLIGGQTLAASVPSIGGGGMQGLFCVAMILFVTLIPFFAFRHISAELGPGRIKAMLFGGVARAQPPA